MRHRCGLGWALLAWLWHTGASVEPNRYLLISAPRHAKVSYAKLGSSTVHNLIDNGLKTPQGLAVDQKLKRLFVADPDSKKIFYFRLLFSNGFMRVQEDLRGVGAENVEARWVAVDGLGSIYFTDEKTNLVMKVSADKILNGDPTPSVLYAGTETPEVSAPGGIGVDNFHVFWTNKAVGLEVGSVARGFEQPPATNAQVRVKALAKNVMKSYGLCLVKDNVYYTDAEHTVYAVKKSGGAITVITEKMLTPRGCSWDGDGTVYIADKTANAVYSFAGNMYNLRSAHMTKAVDFEDAFGVAVVSAGHRAVATALAAAILAASRGLL